MRKPRTGKFIAMLAAVAMASFLLDCQSSIPDWALRMNTASITLFPRFTDRLIADDYAQGLQAQALTWVSSDPSVASVDGSGFVTAIAVGASTVTAVDKAGLSASCEVTVRALPVLGNLDEAVLPEYQEGNDEQGIPTGLVGAIIAPIPAQMDLRPYVGNGWDQGDQGSCVAFALAELMTYKETRKAGLSSPNGLSVFAPAFIYNQVATTSYSGITMEAGFSFLKLNGVCLESLMGYGSNPFPKAPTLEATMNAGLHKIAGYKAVSKDTATIKLYLGHGVPIVVAVICYPDLFGLNSSNPVYDTRPFPIPPSPGYHALLLLGYDDSRAGGEGAFLFRNSWGDGWGVEGGDGYILYTFFSVVTNVAYRIDDIAAIPARAVRD